MVRSSFAEQVDFPLTRVGVNAGGLLIGAIETTSQAVSQTIQYLLDNPDLLGRVREAAALQDRNAFDAMVWEVLRFVPISPYMFRQASLDQTIAKGTDHETRIAALRCAPGSRIHARLLASDRAGAQAFTTPARPPDSA